jgi:hypothetical protein
VQGTPADVITYRCLSACVLSVVVTMSKKLFPLAFAQRIIVTFLR